MEELIKITKDENGNDVVSGKRLHEVLEIRTKFFDWIKRMIDYGFVENVDYSKLSTENQGFIYDYAITIEMAKEISMIQRTEEGKKARQYFIACEKKLKEIISIPKIRLPRSYAEALRALACSVEENEALQLENQKMLPKAEFFDTVTQSETTLDMAEVSKIINIKGLGRNNLIKRLKELKVLRESGEPYQEYVTREWFKCVEVPKDSKNGVLIFPKTVVFQKGIDGIIKLLANKLPSLNN